MIKSRRVVEISPSLSCILGLKENETVHVSRGGEPFIFVHRSNSRYIYGPLDEDSQPLLSESVKLSADEARTQIPKFFELNKGYTLEVTKPGDDK